MNLRVLFVTLCLWVVLGGPWLRIKAQPSGVRTLSAEDAVQDSRIEDLTTRESQTSVDMQKMWDAIGANNTAIAGIQGEERAIGAILGGLSILQIFLSSRKSRSAG